MFDSFLKMLGVRSLDEIVRELEKEVTIIEYPRGTATPLLISNKIKVIEGEPEYGWRKPYLKIRGERALDFFGMPQGVLINGLAEALLYVSGSLMGIRDKVPQSILRVYVYPGLPCYFVLKEIGKLTYIDGLTIEVISVDNEERYELLKRLGVNKVPTFEFDGEYLYTGRLSAEELYFLIMKKIRARELNSDKDGSRDGSS
ncbi:hypothetical protein EYM_02895 [Ignicoccus islandicus DSM 13165]|uniref:Thioredoxin-like fold domain-containing protein n=1 Tax=Ignicoccus islandicus DSM 13165 TaxID=940295 RepID=A0A0U3FQ05_9CREN|nr:hypothetical protein [Ignicoccus islandicus]ALU12367.1 hypothetical protein EYM_02895 [Ignicoccus islandicus DSM 13165]